MSSCAWVLPYKEAGGGWVQGDRARMTVQHSETRHFSLTPRYLSLPLQVSLLVEPTITQHNSPPRSTFCEIMKSFICENAIYTLQERGSPVLPAPPVMSPSVAVQPSPVRDVKLAKMMQHSYFLNNYIWVPQKTTA